MGRHRLLTLHGATASSLLTGIVGWWNLASTADAAGSNTLTNNGTVTFGADYATFDSASSQSLTDASLTGTSANTAGTLAVWMKRNGNQGTFSGLIELGTSGANSMTLAVNTTTVYLLGYSASSLAVLGNESVNSVNATWTHYAVTWDATATKLYKDGSLDASTSAFSSTIGATPAFAIGRMVSQAYYKGDLRKAGVWNRALTLGEIGRLAANATYPNF